ncbi:hypothetical protein BDQ17DRAFT_1425465 [Cyathus striatus]|nr:hypothetical protein BDQ17DRAFT_1425465 [Cyathus striatus]
MSNTSGKNELNNALQRAGKRATYVYSYEGPESSRTWIAIVYIDDMEYGRGSASNKNDAGHAAARSALEQLVRVTTGSG